MNNDEFAPVNEALERIFPVATELRNALIAFTKTRKLKQEKEINHMSISEIVKYAIEIKKCPLMIS